jgi:hypothetical protein
MQLISSLKDGFDLLLTPYLVFPLLRGLFRKAPFRSAKHMFIAALHSSTFL